MPPLHWSPPSGSIFDSMYSPQTEQVVKGEIIRLTISCVLPHSFVEIRVGLGSALDSPEEPISPRVSDGIPKDRKGRGFAVIPEREGGLEVRHPDRRGLAFGFLFVKECVVHAESKHLRGGSGEDGSGHARNFLFQFRIDPRPEVFCVPVSREDAPRLCSLDRAQKTHKVRSQQLLGCSFPRRE